MTRLGLAISVVMSAVVARTSPRGRQGTARTLGLLAAIAGSSTGLAGCCAGVALCAPQPCGGRGFVLTIRLGAGPIAPVTVLGPPRTSCTTAGSTTTCRGSAPVGDTQIVISARGYESRTLRFTVAAISEECFRCPSDAITEDVSLLSPLGDSGPAFDAPSVDANPTFDSRAVEDASALDVDVGALIDAPGSDAAGVEVDADMDDADAEPADAAAFAADAPGVDAELVDAASPDDAG